MSNVRPNPWGEEVTPFMKIGIIQEKLDDVQDLLDVLRADLVWTTEC